MTHRDVSLPESVNHSRTSEPQQVDSTSKISSNQSSNNSQSCDALLAPENRYKTYSEFKNLCPTTSSWPILTIFGLILVFVFSLQLLGHHYSALSISEYFICPKITTKMGGRGVLSHNFLHHCKIGVKFLVFKKY